MRILFYLPAVTPWWFEHIVAPLVRTLAAVHEVHVLVPPLWRNTGIGPAQLGPCRDLDHVAWHIWDADDHAAIRTGTSEALVEHVHAIAPDLSFCRSADMTAPERFPGTVRYLMEGGAWPLAGAPDWLMLQEAPFDHGCVPLLAPVEAAALDALFAPVWAALRGRHALAPGARAGARASAGFGSAPVVALPLEYAHEENVFRLHGTGGTNAELVARIAAQLPAGWTLAVTDHPLNRLYVDDAALDATVAGLWPRVRLVEDTGALAAIADGMIVENSKSFAAAAFHGLPLFRRSAFRTGDWLHALDDLDGFFAAIADGRARGAGEAEARRWFGYHLANCVIDPDHAETDADLLLGHVARPCDPARWAPALARYQAAEVPAAC